MPLGQAPLATVATFLFEFLEQSARTAYVSANCKLVYIACICLNLV